MLWVVCYDIPDDKRRTKVMKILEGYGRRAQYSVFECDIGPARVDQLEQRLRRTINDEEDDVRFYPLDEGEVKRIRLLGRATLRRAQSAYMV